MSPPDYDKLTQERRHLLSHLTSQLPVEIRDRADVNRALRTAFNCGFDAGLSAAVEVSNGMRMDPR